MKRAIIILCVTLCFISCSKTKVEKANELIAEQELGVSPISTLDSLNYYKDCLELRIKAASITHEADSTLKAGVKRADEMVTNGQARYVKSYAENLRDNCVAMYRIAYKYKQDANYGVMRHALAKEPKEFLGFQCVVSNDSLTYRVAFDKDVSKILVIEKEKK